MLVCPNCRSDNLEDAPVCRHCGGSLEPVSTPMRRVERGEEEEPHFEFSPGRRTSAWPLVIGALVVGLGLLGWGLFAALKPNPCEGKYSSALFSYCANIPTGWAGGSRFDPEGNLDRYQQLPGEGESATGGAETTVQVSQVLDPTVSTQQYAQQFRTSQEANGLNPGPVEVIVIDGEQAVAWDFSSPPGQGQAPLHVRDVIAVRPDGAWQIRFVATQEAYEEARFAFEEMLASWRWKA